MNVKQFHVLECWCCNTTSSVQEHGGSLLFSVLKLNWSDDVTIQNNNIVWNQVYHGILLKPPLDLQDALELVYAKNAVGHMLTGKALVRAVRGHFLVDAALNTLLVCNTFNIPLPANTRVYDAVQMTDEPTGMEEQQEIPHEPDEPTGAQEQQENAIEPDDPVEFLLSFKRF